MRDDAPSMSLRPSARFILASGWMLAANIIGFVTLRLTSWLSLDSLFFRAFIPGWWLIFTCCLLGAAIAYLLITYFSL